jgi:prepilin-type N-terminal cleavage/methylation domain-containing protein
MRLAYGGSARRAAEKTRAQRGMTLIEVLVASFILLVAMAGIVPLFLSGLTQASTIRMKSTATNIAREKMERIRQLDYREIYTEAMRASDTTLGTRTLESLFGTSETVRGSSFSVAYTVHNQGYQTGNLKEVTVDVAWTAPPKVSAAEITTLVHQQFLGPRGSRLDLSSAWDDTLGSPFDVIRDTTRGLDPASTKAKYYIAQADWGLVYYDLTQTTPVARNVYMRLAAFDDDGQSVPLGPSANDYKLGTSYLHFHRDAGGSADAVWFEYDFNPALIPDGYWEMRAVAYNEYNEPGNTWRLRVRTETGQPAAPTSFTATAQSDNHTVVLNWATGAERDRDHYVLERRTWNFGTGSWLAWVNVSSDVDPMASSYTDVGNAGSGQDPWGNASTQNYYQYSLWAVDSCDPPYTGPATQAQTYVPSATTTTTTVSSSTTSSTSTTSTSSTTTTTHVYSVTIQNNSGTSYSVTIKNGSGATVWSGTAKKNKTTTVSGLVNGSYQVTATASGKSTLTSSFTLPPAPSGPVMTIN